MGSELVTCTLPPARCSSSHRRGSSRSSLRCSPRFSLSTVAGTPATAAASTPCLPSVRSILKLSRHRLSWPVCTAVPTLQSEASPTQEADSPSVRATRLSNLRRHSRPFMGTFPAPSLSSFRILASSPDRRIGRMPLASVPPAAPRPTCPRLALGGASGTLLRWRNGLGRRVLVPFSPLGPKSTLPVPLKRRPPAKRLNSPFNGLRSSRITSTH
mmetsp:Transcript_4217/g.9105  ORF Transcript_4217/g.9105 Transcript_4217/m.9105 type:complete len:214 (+) Transcript_4217:322-963(+)